MKKAVLFLSFVLCFAYSAVSQDVMSMLDLVLQEVNASCPMQMDEEGTVMNRLVDDGKNIIFDFTVSDDMFNEMNNNQAITKDFIKETWIEGFREMAKDEGFAAILTIIQMSNKGLDLKFRPTTTNKAIDVYITNEEVGSILP